MVFVVGSVIVISFLCLAGQTVFDLATDALMKQVLEGRVSVQLWVRDSGLHLSYGLVDYLPLSLSGYDSPRQEVWRTPIKGELHVTDDHNSDRGTTCVQVINISTWPQRALQGFKKKKNLEECF